ncbi:MAG: hypothetical protein ACM3VW_04550 [Bacteroidota bacterium]
MNHGSDDERNLFGPPPEEMLAELQRLALRLDVEIRSEGTGGRVGRCLLHGRRIVMMEKSLPHRDKVEGLARALADLDYEDVYLSPACRDLLEGYRSRGN